MMILLFKAAARDDERTISDDGERDEALEKIHAGFVAAVKEAKTKEEREAAERRLQELDAG